jgi:hypothetical protein
MKKKEETIEINLKPRNNKEIIVTFRLFQAFCFGLCALGVSIGASDYGSSIQSPFSAMSIITTSFGLLGSIISGILANSAKKW